MPASFRGAGFYIDYDSADVGRRSVLHVFPGRELPYNEDMGRRGRRFDVEAFTLGTNYKTDAEALMAACEEAGPGELVHPIFGTMQVICRQCRAAFSATVLNEARFSLSFEEAGQRTYPSSTVDTTAQAATSANTARQVAGDVFRDVYSTIGMTFLRVLAAGDIQAALGMIRSVVAALPSPFDSAAVTGFLGLLDEATTAVEAALDAGAEGVADIFDDVLGALADMETDAQGQVSALLEVANFGTEAAAAYGGALTTSSAATPATKTAARNQSSLVSLVSTLAAAHGITAALNTDYEAWDDLVAVRDAALDVLDAAMFGANDDDVHQALRQLQADANAAFNAKGASLAHVVEVEAPAGPLPALVLAYQRYQDLGREAQIISRNKLARPNALSGRTIRILNA
ncbi:DNA circularization protein [Desulfarculus baarsii]